MKPKQKYYLDSTTTVTDSDGKKTVTHGEPPPPEVLLEDAMEEPDRRILEPYGSVIVELRRKHFTFREIAEWFCERGIDVDHNAVYRIYTKGMSDVEAAQEDQADDEEERSRQF